MADEQKKSGFLSDLFAPVGGFGVTFSTMFRKVATEEYPEEKRPTQPRFHGRHQLNRHPDGLEKCVGCELCAWACPADAILVEGADNDDTEGGGARSAGAIFWRVMFWVVVAIIVLIAVFPFYYAILSSFESGTDLFRVNYLPESFDLSNYQNALSRPTFIADWRPTATASWPM